MRDRLGGMNANLLEREVLGLSSSERARLAAELIESLEAPSDGEIEELWCTESARRAQQIDSGEVILIPAETVAARAAEFLR